MAAPSMEQVANILEVRELRKWYPVRRGLLASLVGGRAKHVKAVDGVSFSLKPGEVLGLAGESGCGKSTTGMTVLNLHAPSKIGRAHV